MKINELHFQGASGRQLAARLGVPDEGKPMAYALFAHCFTCNKNYKAIANISRAMADRGMGVLRFDFTGLGESEGDFAETNFSSNVADLVAAAEFLEAEYQAPTILVGHSLGGAAVLQAARKIRSAAALVTVSAPSETGSLAHLLRSRAEEIEDQGVAQVEIGGRTFPITKQLLDDLERTHMQETIGNLDRALLVCHSPQDKTVDIQNAVEIFQAARYPKAFLSIDGADHLLSNMHDSMYVGTVITAWAQKYL
jgi:alpha/beta superfamily hydrolase